MRSCSPCCPTTRPSRHVAFGENGIVASLAPGATHVSSSTISVALSERLAAAHAEAGQQYAAAPVFGRPEAASAAKLFVIAAGAPQVLEPLVPLFDVIGQRTFVVSDQPHTANLVKLSGNFLLASAIETVSEAVALVGKAGANRQQYVDILTSTLFAAPALSDLWRADRATGIRAGRHRSEPRSQGRPAGARRRGGAASAAARGQRAARPLAHAGGNRRRPPGLRRRSLRSQTGTPA